MKDIKEHCILHEKIFEKIESKEKENEEQNFNFFIFLCHMVKRHISRFPNPSPTQICKGVTPNLLMGIVFSTQLTSTIMKKHMKNIQSGAEQIICPQE